MEITNGHSVKSNESEITSNTRVLDRKSRSSSGKGDIADVVLRMHSDLVDYGRKRAALSRDIELNADDIRSLEEHAEAMAREVYREAYDPNKHEEHKLREAEHLKSKEARPEAELIVDYAQADVEKLEDEISHAQSNMKPPTRPQVLMLSAVAGLALTIAPTLHDYVFITMKDDVLNWAISLLSAAIYGVFITWGLLDSDDAGGRRTVRSWLGIVGGVGIPIGLGALRVANAVGGSEIWFAVALTIIEIGIVILLESRAATLRIAYQEWAAQQAVLREITTRLDAARNHLTRSKQRLADINGAIDAHLAAVEELSLRNFNIERIVVDAVKAVRDGYFEGLATNRGYLRGVRRVA